MNYNVLISSSNNGDDCPAGEFFSADFSFLFSSLFKTK